MPRKNRGVTSGPTTAADTERTRASYERRNIGIAAINILDIAIPSVAATFRNRTYDDLPREAEVFACELRAVLPLDIVPKLIL